MCGKTKRYRIKNEEIRNKLRVSSIVNNLRECRLRFFGHVQKRPKDAPVRRIENLNIGDLVKRKGKLLKIWMQVIRKDMIVKGFVEEMVLDKNEWRRSIRTN